MGVLFTSLCRIRNSLPMRESSEASASSAALVFSSWAARSRSMVIDFFLSSGCKTVLSRSQASHNFSSASRRTSRSAERNFERATIIGVVDSECTRGDQGLNEGDNSSPSGVGELLEGARTRAGLSVTEVRPCHDHLGSRKGFLRLCFRELRYKRGKRHDVCKGACLLESIHVLLSLLDRDHRPNVACRGEHEIH